MFNLKRLTTQIQGKKTHGYLAAALTLAAQLSFAQGNISFTADQAYPESAAWSAKDQVFFVSSVHHGVIGKVTLDGKYSSFISDESLIGTVGLKLDAKKNILWVANSDSGASDRSTASTTGKLASLVAYNATTGKKISSIDLAKLSAGSHFANDLALDDQGNIYITDSFSPVIYRVDSKGVASIFTTSEMFKGDGFNLNGIVYHPSGFLLVCKYNSGELFKIDVKNPTQIEKVSLPKEITGADGLILRSANQLIAVQNMGIDTIIELETYDNWKSAEIKHEQKSILPFPTAATVVGKDIYVLNAQLGSLFSPTAAKVSEYLLQKL